jgi:uncharacterized protein (DUF2267 family)
LKFIKQKEHEMLEDKANLPQVNQAERGVPTQRIDTSEAREQGREQPIHDKDKSFLEKVMTEGKLADPYDARDITEVVFRVMRDLMTKDTIEHVEGELHKEALPTKDKTLEGLEISDLWKDTNPIVGFLSRIRQPLKGPAPAGIDSNLFFTRVAREGGIPPTTDAETVIRAVFSATKAELSSERVQEISGWLPDEVQKLWQEA